VILNQLPRMIVVVAFFVGFVVTTQAAPKQTICPLMIEDEIDEEEFILYKGVKVLHAPVRGGFFYWTDW